MNIKLAFNIRGAFGRLMKLSNKDTKAKFS
jgi:hypothetical protein